MDMTRSERAEFYNRNHWRMPKDVPFCINCEHFISITSKVDRQYTQSAWCRWTADTVRSHE